MAGACLLAGAAAEIVQGFRRRNPASQRSAWTSAGYTLVLAVLLLNAPWLAATALAIFVAVPFAVDALRSAGVAVRQLAGSKPFVQAAGAAAWNLAVVVAILLVGRWAANWVVALAAGLRLAATTAALAVAPVHSDLDTEEGVIADIGIERPERLAETGARLQRAELERVAADRSWILSLLAVLFAIHVSRMGFDRSALGILSPLVAVSGDVVFALALTYFVIVPLPAVRAPSHARYGTAGVGVGTGAPARTGLALWGARAVRLGLESRMRFAIRVRAARYSLTSALGRGLQIGLPMAAIIVASVPIWGMSWYFDTENWAAGIWNSWAAQRTDTWREAMVRRGRRRRSDDARRTRLRGGAGGLERPRRRSRSSSSATPARAMRASTCCATR